MKTIKNTSKEKLRGGFYTPKKIADFILKWAVNGNKNYEVLEPSCGDGIFLEEIKRNKFDYKSLLAIEYDVIEAEKAKEHKLNKCEIITGDFFKFCNSTNKKFDLIIGNPPYIRYQYFKKEFREEVEIIFKKVNLKYSKLTNAWVPFIIGSSLLLKEKAKIGFVLPAEILQVSYAKQLREYLSFFFNKINIVSFKKLVFPTIQQEVVLLLCEKIPDSNEHLIEHIEVNDANELELLDIAKLKSPKKKIDFKNDKWAFYFLEQNEIDFLEKIINSNKIKSLGEYAQVEVGITTGSNEFFTVNSNIINEFNLNKYAKPLVGRSVQITSCIFNESDWKKNVESGAKAHILLFPKKKDLLTNEKILNYIKKGEEEGINEWYKCKIRNEWQIIPSIWISELLFIRRNNKYPRMIINKAGAYTTDTLHRVRIKKNIDINAFVASYYNSLSFAFAELSGRSHGGGVLELMPNEAEKILIPYEIKNSKLLNNIDLMLREGKNIDDILKFTDRIILKENYGFSDREINLANSIWKKLLNRRLNRNK